MSYLAKYNETLEAHAARVAGMWRHWESFAWSERPEDCDRWAIVYTTNRDADCLTRANHEAIMAIMAPYFDGDDVCRESHNHWACGWVGGFSVRVFAADGAITPAFRAWHAICERLADYPVLNSDRLSEIEREEADDVWQHCYSVAERLEYIRKHRSQFDFRSFADMLGCVRGCYFAGCPSELLS